MYYLDDGVTHCGMYECPECGSRFLDAKVLPKILCPYCDSDADMELGPDEEQEESIYAVLLEEIDGAEEVERTDGLLSLATTGGDYSWI